MRSEAKALYVVRSGAGRLPSFDGARAVSYTHLIDQHLKGFRALGAEVDIEHGKIMAEAERLTGKHIYFDVVSVGATINVMMAATMAEGITILENVAKEPYVVDVANFLNSMGANIRGAGTDVIKIRGVQRLHEMCIRDSADTVQRGKVD